MPSLMVLPQTMLQTAYVDPPHAQASLGSTADPIRAGARKLQTKIAASLMVLLKTRKSVLAVLKL